MARIADIGRKTRETDISMKLSLDGTGKANICTGIGFFDHMMEGFARHGLFDLELSVKGDLQVDSHHTIEDTGIVLGNAIREALGDKKGIRRYGHFILPMDECLVLCAVDLCGRPYLAFEDAFTVPKCGDMDTEMVREFFYAVSYGAMMNLHIKVLTPGNNHHMMEAMFKAFAKALDMAVSLDERIKDVLSTKGSL
ncbi:MAG: imidazoleglycerol-phosphate dehydratase HisB [Lachnospiraceae bacterium]|nr:imidazoleglycerol-phosphate dehydratase HisB [Lachnospiraceae bacterium]